MKEKDSASLGEQFKMLVRTYLYDCLSKMKTEFRHLHSLIAPSEDLVFDEVSLQVYLQKALWSYVYRFFFFGFIIYYLLFLQTVSVFGRSIFAFLCLYLPFKIYWAIPKNGVLSLQLCGIFEGSCFSIILLLIGRNKIAEVAVFNCLYIVSIVYLSRSLRTNIIIAVISSIYIGIAMNFLFTPKTGLLAGICFALFFYFTQVLKLINDLNYNEFISKSNVARHNAEQAIQNKNMYYSSVTHDLKNPLNSILGTIDFLKSSRSIQKADKCMLMTASYSGQVLLYLIGNILDASKIEAGRFDVDRIPMSIVEEIEKIGKIELEIAKPKGINLHTRFLSPLPKMVFGDPMRFTQIIINLVGNSIKFTTRGYVGIVAKWAKDAEEAKENYFEELIKSTQAAKSNSAVFIPPEEFFLSCSPCMEHRKNVLTSLSLKPYQEIRWKKGEESPPVPIETELPNETVKQRLQKYNEKPRKKTKETYFSLSPSTKQVLLTQADNAIKIEQRKSSGFKDTFEEANGSNLSTNNGAIFGDSGLLVIEIIDTGPGMNEEEQKRLFQPFSQANRAVKRKFGGTGLGLWISKQLVNLMCGLIEVRSQPSVGTIFKLTIPFKVVEGEEAMPRQHLEEKKGVQSLMWIEQFGATSSGNSQEMSCLRTVGKFACKGRNTTIKGLKILIIENVNGRDDSKLDQMMSQLSSYSCDLFYSLYSSASLSLKISNFDFRIIFVLACSIVSNVKNAIIEIQQAIKEKNITPIPIVVVSGK